MKVGLELESCQFAIVMIKIRSGMILHLLRNINEEEDIFMVSKCLFIDRSLIARQEKKVIIYQRNQKTPSLYDDNYHQ